MKIIIVSRHILLISFDITCVCRNIIMIQLVQNYMLLIENDDDVLSDQLTNRTSTASHGPHTDYDCWYEVFAVAIWLQLLLLCGVWFLIVLLLSVCYLCMSNTTRSWTVARPNYAGVNQCQLFINWLIVESRFVDWCFILWMRNCLLVCLLSCLFTDECLIDWFNESLICILIHLFLGCLILHVPPKTHWPIYRRPIRAPHEFIWCTWLLSLRICCIYRIPVCN